MGGQGWTEASLLPTGGRGPVHHRAMMEGPGAAAPTRPRSETHRNASHLLLQTCRGTEQGVAATGARIIIPVLDSVSGPDWWYFMRQTDRQRDIQVDEQVNRYTERQADR